MDDDTADDRPPKPYEDWLGAVLTSAYVRARPEVEQVVVRGRAALVVVGDTVERYLIPETFIDMAIGAARGGPGIVGDLALAPWDDAAGSEPVDDGSIWTDDDQGGHWCLEPESCAILRAQG